MAFLDVSKEDFVNAVHGSVPADRLPGYYDVSTDRVNLILLTVMTWAGAEARSKGMNLYLSFRHVANWMKMAYHDHLLSKKQRAYLRSLSFENLLELVWETTQVARFDARAVSAYLYEHLPS